jgi:hypothetical protein
MYKSNDSRMTAGQLKRGFEKMPRPYPAAILFSLEMSMNAEEVVMLTRLDAGALRKLGKLTEFAAHILDSQPIHIASKYVFWHEVNSTPMPLFGLDAMVFEAFGLLWGELGAACGRLIWIDEDAEAAAWDFDWQKHLMSK